MKLEYAGFSTHRHVGLPHYVNSVVERVDALYLHCKKYKGKLSKLRQEFGEATARCQKVGKSKVVGLQGIGNLCGRGESNFSCCKLFKEQLF